MGNYSSWVAGQARGFDEGYRLAARERQRDPAKQLEDAFLQLLQQGNSTDQVLEFASSVLTSTERLHRGSLAALERQREREAAEREQHRIEYNRRAEERRLHEAGVAGRRAMRQFRALAGRRLRPGEAKRITEEATQRWLDEHPLVPDSEGWLRLNGSPYA